MTTLAKSSGWALALAATATMAVSYVDRQTLAVLAPTVTKALAISDQQYGWLVSAFSVAYLVGPPLAGPLLDRVGARRGLLGAVLVWSAVAALHALAPGFGVLFGLRIALGLAESPSFPGSAQVIHRALPPAERARAFGVLFTGSSFGAMVAPPLATALESRFGWRTAFLGTAAVGLAWVPLWLHVAFKPGARALLDAKLPTATPAAERPRFFEVLRHPAVLRAGLVVLASAPAIAFVMNWGAKYLVRDHGLTQADVGRYLWLPPALFDIGAVAFGHFGTRHARRHGTKSPRALFAGAAVLSLSLAAMPWVGTPWTSIGVAAVSLAGGGGLFALLTAQMLSRVPAAAVSTASGTTAAAQSLALIVSSALVGRMVERHGTYTWIILGLAAWLLPGCLAWLIWREPRSEG